MQEAIEADGLNPLARYEYASVLISLERYHDAIAELERLKVCTPCNSEHGTQRTHAIFDAVAACCEHY